MKILVELNVLNNKSLPGAARLATVRAHRASRVSIQDTQEACV